MFQGGIMKNLVWSVVLVAALAFVFTACGPDESESISVTLHAPAEGNWTGFQWEATSDTDDVTYQWTLDGTPIGTSSTCTPSNKTSGLLKVTITKDDLEDYSTAFVAPGVLYSANGWKMAGSANGSLNYNEDVTITPTSFKLVESKTNGSASGGQFTFTITDWAPLTTTAPSNIGNNAEVGSGYGNYIKVTGSYTEKVGDYASLTGTEFYIRLNDAGNSFCRSRIRTTDSGEENDWIARKFARQN
jgi:hypothetical protein